jgi:hypothetical protein
MNAAQRSTLNSRKQSGEIRGNKKQGKQKIKRWTQHDDATRETKFAPTGWIHHISSFIVHPSNVDVDVELFESDIMITMDFFVFFVHSDVETTPTTTTA